MAITQQSADEQERERHPWAGIGEDTEGECVLAWFEREIWHDRQCCSHCFAPLRSVDELEVDDWGNVVEESSYRSAAERGWDVDDKGTIGLRTVRNDDQAVTGVEVRDTHSARSHEYERTTCGACGSVGGLAQSDSLSTDEALDRVPDLIARLEERGHDVNHDAVYAAVRSAKSDQERSNNDKRVFASAAATGIKLA